MRAVLLVSLSGASARSMERCVELADELDRRGVPLSLLVVPRAPGDAATRDWLRSHADTVLMHGFDHNADPAARNGHRLGRRAEFAALPAHEAGLRLYAAAAVMDRLGLRTDAFAPPRWLASPGTLAALRRRGFVVCADATGVRDLRTGVVHRGRVLGFALLGAVRGERAEPWWCRAMVLGAGRAARRGGLVRLAVDAADLTRSGRRQALLDAVDLALHHGARPASYLSMASRTPVPGDARPQASNGSPCSATRTSVPEGARLTKWL